MIGLGLEDDDLDDMSRQGDNKDTDKDNDNDETAADKKLEEERLRKRHLLYMTLFHFVVAFPKWCLPLFLWLASQAIPFVPDFEDTVRAPLEQLKMVVHEESKAYHQCTLDAFQRLDHDMRWIAEAEFYQSQNRRSENQKLLDEMDVTMKSCTLAGLSARESLKVWSVTDNQTLPFLSSSDDDHDDTTTMCSHDDRTYIATSLGQDYQEFEKELSTVVRDYAASSESSFGQVREYAELRVDYDYNFLLRDRVLPAIALLEELAQSPFHTIEFLTRPQDIVNDLLSHLAEFERVMETLQVRLQILQERLEEFKESIDQFVEGYDYLLERFKQVIQLVEEWNPNVPGVGIPDYATLQGIYTSAHFLPPVFEIPTFSTELNSIDMLLEAFSANALQVVEDLVDRLEEAANSALFSKTREVVHQIRDLLNLDGYDPPEYKGSRPEISSMEEEWEYLTAIGETTKANAMLALQKALGLNNSSVEDLIFDYPEVDSGNFSFVGNATTFTYQDPDLPNIGVPEWLLVFINTLLVYKIYVDWAIQSLRMFMLKRKYEVNAKPDDANIDYTKKDGEDDESGDGTAYLSTAVTTVMTIARNFLSVWLLVFLLALPLTIFAMTVYLPHVHENCLVSEEGTFSAHIYAPILINQASAPGNALHVEGEFECRYRQRLICDQMFAESDLLYKEDVLTFSNLLQQFNQSQTWNSRLERCIDTNTLDPQFKDACCGLEGYDQECSVEPGLRDFRCPIDRLTNPPTAFDPVGDYVSEPACKVDSSQWKLQDSRFDCQVLESSCSSTPCTGVNEELIRLMASEADCRIHLFSLRSTLTIVLVLYYAVVLNVSCALILNGVKGIFRKRLVKEEKIVVAVKKDGEVVKADTLEKARKDIEKKEKRGVIKGWIQLCFGVVSLILGGVSFWKINEFSPLNE